MKYKLIDKKTGQVHICLKKIVNGYSYYVSSSITDITQRHVWHKSEKKFHPYLKRVGNTFFAIEEFEKGNFLKLIATDDPEIALPNIDILLNKKIFLKGLVTGFIKIYLD
jgi:hypothetical protein